MGNNVPKQMQTCMHYLPQPCHFHFRWIIVILSYFSFYPLYVQLLPDAYKCAYKMISNPKMLAGNQCFTCSMTKELVWGSTWLWFGVTKEKNPKPTFFLMNLTIKKRTYTQTDFFILRGFSLWGNISYYVKLQGIDYNIELRGIQTCSYAIWRWRRLLLHWWVVGRKEPFPDLAYFLKRHILSMHINNFIPSTLVSMGCVAGGGSSVTDSRISSSNAAS